MRWATTEYNTGNPDQADLGVEQFVQQAVQMLFEGYARSYQQSQSQFTAEDLEAAYRSADADIQQGALALAFNTVTPEIRNQLAHMLKAEVGAGVAARPPLPDEVKY